MKRLIEFFATQGLFGNLLTFFIIVVGIYTALSTRREIFPNISFDVILVTTVYKGASATDVEQLVTNPLERELKEVDGIKKMSSGSIEGRSVIVLELDVNATTEEQAKNDVRDVVERFSDLPLDAEKPIVTSMESKQQPLIEVSVEGNIPPIELRQISRELEKEIENIDGVASVKPLGMQDLEVRVETDPLRLSRYQVSLEDLIISLKKQNVSISGGNVESTNSNPTEKIVRTVGEFSNINEIENTVIRANDFGRSVRVRDVAEVTMTLTEPSTMNRTNGLPTIRLTILKEEREDAIHLVDRVKKRVDDLIPTLDKRVHISYVNDASEYIRRRLNILLGNFSIGFLCVLLLLPLLLPFKFSLLIAIGEPFAFLGAMLLFHVLDISINMVSLIGLIIVSGILVDDGIVVVDNIVQKIQKGVTPLRAAILGSQQMWVPIIASSLTTIVAFLPMMMMSGIFGKFTRYIPYGVILPILMSLFENFFIMPHHVGEFIRSSDFNRTPRNIFTRMSAYSQGVWELTVVPFYIKTLRIVIHYRYRFLLSVMALFFSTLLLAWKGMRTVLFPPEGVEIFVIRVDAPTGTPIHRTAELVKPIENSITKLPKKELRDFITTIGLQAQSPHDPNTKRGEEYAQIIVYLTPENERERKAYDIIEDTRSRTKTITGLERIVFERINPGPPVGRPVSIGVRGKNYEDILPAAHEVKERLKKIQGVSDIEDNNIIGKEEIRVEVNGEEASAANLTVDSIGNHIRAAYEGVVATSMRKLDEEIDVRVSLTKEAREKESTLNQLKIGNPRGFLIPLNKVARLSHQSNMAVYSHEDNERQIQITGEIDTKITSSSRVNQEMRKETEKLKSSFPKVSFHFGGEDTDTKESLESLFKSFMVAIFSIFLILVATFKKLLQPLVILVSIPLGMIAVILTFFVHGLPITFLGLVGMVGLSGIIVNSAIVFIDFVNQARKEGEDKLESLIQAAKLRIRPIFLTSVTTAVGILPTGYGFGGLDKFVVPIALAMGWGLVIGSLLTVYIIPAILATLDDFTLKKS